MSKWIVENEARVMVIDIFKKMGYKVNQPDSKTAWTRAVKIAKSQVNYALKFCSDGTVGHLYNTQILEQLKQM